MIYNSPKLLLEGIKTFYLDLSLNTQTSDNFDNLILKTTTDSNVEKYPVLNALGEIREWIDEITYNGIQDFYLEVANIPYQEGYMVDRFTLTDSKKTLGAGLETFIRGQYEAWRQFPKKKITEMLDRNPNAFDGTPFFANSRPNFETIETINNIVTGSGTTRSNLMNDLGSAIDRLRTFKNKKGVPFNVNTTFAVLIPSKFERDFRAIATQEFLVNGVSNEFKGLIEVVVDPFIPDNDWYVINYETPYKFAVVQEDVNNPVTWDYKDEPDSRYIKYFTTGRMGFGLLNPLAIVKVNN